MTHSLKTRQDGLMQHSALRSPARIIRKMDEKILDLVKRSMGMADIMGRFVVVHCFDQQVMVYPYDNHHSVIMSIKEAEMTQLILSSR